MSELIDALKLRETGKIYAELGPVCVVKEEEYKEHFGTLIEFSLEATFATRITVRRDEINHVKPQAERMVRQAVFGEYASLLQRIRYAAYNRDYQEVDNLVSKIEESMFNV